MGEAVFLLASGTSRGGLAVGIEIRSKEEFLKLVDRWNEDQRNRESKWTYHPTYRYAFIDGADSKLLKNMTVTEFEAIFNEEDIKRLGRLLEHSNPNAYGGNYPVFLKAVYLKYGYAYKE